ncbi:MAG: hypothetical protein SFU25_02575 [Candidatus Caenarcaniphilales bacterium]|nr:hypothetical protein [Candidatus Caenarcaniphilales bacterium]
MSTESQEIFSRSTQFRNVVRDKTKSALKPVQNIGQPILREASVVVGKFSQNPGQYLSKLKPDFALSNPFRQASTPSSPPPSISIPQEVSPGISGQITPPVS